MNIFIFVIPTMTPPVNMILKNNKIIDNNMSEYIIIFPEEFLKENKDTILSWKKCKDKDSFDFNLWKPAP